MKYKLINKSIFFPGEKILAIADLHMGYEEVLNRQGIMVPRRQFRETVEDLKKIFAETGKINEVVICGDFKHAFGSILKQEWNDVFLIIDFLEANCEKIILVKGNHDMVLEPLAGKKNILVEDFYIKEDVLFLHGNKEIPEIGRKEIGMMVMGHRHPAVMIADKYKQEKFKCFLVGKFRGKETVILPSFLPLVEGGEIVGDENNLLFIPDRDLMKFEVFVVGEEVLDFGKLKDIGNLD
jgi:uncharacterized protein